HVVLARIEFVEGDPETYALPLAFAAGERAGQVRADHPQHLVARLRAGDEDGLVYCALRDRGFAEALLQAVGRRRRFRGAAGETAGRRAAGRRGARGREEGLALSARGLDGDCRVFYGERLVLELFRRLEAGPNPDLEVGTFLTETAAFPHAPPVVGFLEYR